MLRERRQALRPIILVVCLCALIALACTWDHAIIRTSSKRRRQGTPLNPLSSCCATYYAPSLAQDARGWLLDPISAASRAGLTGAATDCKSVHVGQIKPGVARGNHRHHRCNETLIIWGGKAKVRVEDPSVSEGYVEFIMDVDEVGVFGCGVGHAHAVVSLDSVNTLHVLGCQDGLADPTNTEFNVWAKFD